MNWLPILALAANTGALASTAIAIFFGFRAATIPDSDEASVGDLQRQSDCAICAGVAGVMAAAAFATGLIAL